jgi:nucleoside-diphosphate-sugar epimerase
VGSHLSEACLARGWSVTGVDCFTDYYSAAVKRSNVELVAGHDEFRLVESDLATDALAPLLEGVDVVFHLAGQPGVRPSWGTSFDAYTSGNVVALQRLLEAAKESSLQKFVFASSSSVYGNSELLPTPESAPLAPVSPYGATKVLGEHLCSIYRRSYAVPVVALRYFSVYGPRQRPEMTVYGDGSQTRDFTYVADIVAATIAAAELAPAGAVYNVGGGSRTSLSEAIALISSEIGVAPTLCSTEHQRGDARDTAADTSRIRHELQFQPAWDVATGLAEQIGWQKRAAETFAPSL